MLVAAGVYGLFPGMTLVPYALTCLATLAVALTVGLVRTFRYLRRL
jgi:Na+/H+ antiporter NhaC